MNGDRDLATSHLTVGHWNDTAKLAGHGLLVGLMTSLERGIIVAARNAVAHRAALDAAFDEQHRMYTTDQRRGDGR